jgi:hypothetical protein
VYFLTWPLCVFISAVCVLTRSHFWGWFLFSGFLRVSQHILAFSGLQTCFVGVSTFVLSYRALSAWHVPFHYFACFFYIFHDFGRVLFLVLCIFHFYMFLILIFFQYAVCFFWCAWTCLDMQVCFLTRADIFYIYAETRILSNSRVFSGMYIRFLTCTHVF